MLNEITLIGSGNVAWHLGKALVKAGHKINTIYSRSTFNAIALANQLPDSDVVSNPDFSKNISRFFIIAVSDNAIEEVVSKITLPENAIVAHTSGSMPMEVLKKNRRHGVFYPLQTFTKEKEINLSEVPFGIEGSDTSTYEELNKLALSLSKNVQPMDSDQRKTIHLAAVFACNFTNHLFSISEEILKEKELNFSLLEALIKETAQKAFEISPLAAQTGPAVRGDEKIMEQQLASLKNEPELQELYRIFSERIKKSK